MGNVASDLWPYIVTAIITAIGTYVGAIHALKVRVAVLEHKCENLQKRVDSHSGKIDQILEGINEIKVAIVKINTTLSIVEKG